MNIKAILVAAAVMAFSMGAGAQTKWDMPTPYSDGEFHTINVRQFADDVKKATGGKLEIVVHSNGSLIKHPDMLRAVSTGQVNIAEFLLGQFGNEDPMFAADNIPFVATGYDNAYRFYQAQRPLLEKKLAGARHAAALFGGMAGSGYLHAKPAEVGRRPEGHEDPHLQPADRASRGAARREPDRDPGAGGAAGVSRPERCTR